MRAFLRDLPWGEEGLVWVTLPCPSIELVDALGALPDAEEQFAYAPRRDIGLCGSGQVRTVRLRGDDRMDQLRAWAMPLLRSVSTHTWPGLTPVAPRVVGGMAFSLGTESDANWQGFGNGGFFLPTWLYRLQGLVPTISRVVDLVREDLDAVADGLHEVIARFEEVTPLGWQPAGVLGPPLAVVEEMSPGAWQTYVEEAVSAIVDGPFEKLVAARRTLVRSRERIDALLVFRRLLAEYPDVNRFLFRFADGAFMGATPESLFTLRQRELVTHALAGSLPLGEGEGIAQRGGAIMSSEKDTAEHAYVVRQIRDALAPFSQRVMHSPSPRVTQVGNILHLDTPVHAILDRDVDAMQLVDALHPTPAVGGLPKWQAVEWIRVHERHPRGWYTGTVGWFDGQQNAEFAVAIRSGLIRGREAMVFAGAGIVRDSEPALEFAETERKLEPMLRALRVVVPP